MENLIEYYRDKYDLTELVEHLNIPFEDFVVFLMEWIEYNPEAVQEDLDLITGDANG